jgi:2-polyprenyl-3-methyl-5-hydroxy-6-metoxy-1,4-benzoquinol methylase
MSDAGSGGHVSDRWARWRRDTDLGEYSTRWQRLAESGQAVHGEADFIESLHPASVLDAGCGMGRLAIELNRRGIAVVGADLDDDLLGYARRASSGIAWVHDDLATMQLGRTFAMVAMTGNVMVFCRPNDRAAIVANLASHIAPDGLLVAGFAIERGSDALILAEYDRLCSACGLGLEQRWATWEGEEYRGGDYAVSVHRARKIDSPTA